METNIHYVKEVKIKEIRELKHKGKKFYTQEISVTDEEGHEDTITLFADKEKNLRVWTKADM